MRRTIAVISVVAFMVAASVAPAFAAGQGPSACKSERPGQLISDIAREEGLNGHINPGNARSLAPPFVPFITNQNRTACNPHAR